MLEQVSDFLSAGGGVLWVILFTLIALWFFILERFYYFYQVLPQKKKRLQEDWSKKKDQKNAIKLRSIEISKLSREMVRFVPTIDTLIAVSPLLGLLGTVTGMISIFDIISFSGTGNPRLMASGISLAVIPTMAGLVTALSGLYFSSYFQKKVKQERENIIFALDF